MRSHTPIIPAILTNSVVRFEQQIEICRTIGAGQIDVVDGVFCQSSPSLLPIEWPDPKLEYTEAHLMVEKPLEYLEALSNKHITRAIVHLESKFDPETIAKEARNRDILLGLAVSPGTDLSVIESYLPFSQYVQIMGVEPGRSGQTLLPETFSAVRYLRTKFGRKITLTVDGGVNLDNAAELFKAGSDYLIASSAIFAGGQPLANYRALLETKSK